MSKPPTKTPPQGDDRNLVAVDENYVAPGFEDKLRLFWEKNRSIVITTCVVIVAAIAAREVIQVVEARKANADASAYTEAGDQAADLRSFAQSHSESPLAGAALLRAADEAYEAGQFGQARTDYAAARAALGDSPLATRAALGAAVAAVQSGATAEGEAAFKEIANNVSAPAAFRAEAAYHLAAIAAQAGRNDEARSFVQQVMSIEAQSQDQRMGIWTQRAFSLQSMLPPAAPAPAEAAAAATGESSGNTTAAPTIKLPGTGN